jgi:hypothetical protein
MGIGFTIFLIVLAFSAGTVLGGLLGSGKREDLERQLAQVESGRRRSARTSTRRSRAAPRGAAARPRSSCTG